MPTHAPSHPQGHGGFIALCLSLALTACGDGEKGQSLTAAPAQTSGPTAKALAAAENKPSASEMASLNAGPRVIQWELVSEKRFDRTRFDYVYRVLIGGAGTNFETAGFKVTSTSPATVVLDGDINIGSLAAGQYLKVPDTFTIRQDRSAPLNKAALQFTFAGTVPAPTLGSDPNLKIGAVRFYRVGGRPGHEGYLPIETSNPPAGEELLLRANIGGNPGKVRYSLMDAADAVLSDGVLQSLGSDIAIFGSPVLVPAKPFRIRLTVEGGSSVPLTWTSPIYAPTRAQVELVLGNPSFKGAGPLIGNILIPASGNPDAYAVRIVLPDGFTAPTNSWTIVPRANEATLVPISIAAPTDVAGQRFKIVVIWRVGQQPAEFVSITQIVGS